MFILSLQSRREANTFYVSYHPQYLHFNKFYCIVSNILIAKAGIFVKKVKYQAANLRFGSRGGDIDTNEIRVSLPPPKGGGIDTNEIRVSLPS